MDGDAAVRPEASFMARSGMTQRCCNAVRFTAFFSEGDSQACSSWPKRCLMKGTGQIHPQKTLPRIRQHATTARAPKMARGIRVFSASIASSAPKGQTAAMSRQPIAESVPLPVCRIRPKKTSRMNAKAQSMRRSRVRFIRLLQGPSLLGLQAGAR